MTLDATSTLNTDVRHAAACVGAGHRLQQHSVDEPLEPWLFRCLTSAGLPLISVKVRSFRRTSKRTAKLSSRNRGGGRRDFRGTHFIVENANLFGGIRSRLFERIRYDSVVSRKREVFRTAQSGRKFPSGAMFYHVRMSPERASRPVPWRQFVKTSVWQPSSMRDSQIS